jgi:hypothetical protein
VRGCSSGFLFGTAMMTGAFAGEQVSCNCAWLLQWLFVWYNDFAGEKVLEGGWPKRGDITFDRVS